MVYMDSALGFALLTGFERMDNIYNHMISFSVDYNLLPTNFLLFSIDFFRTLQYFLALVLSLVRISH